MLDDSADGSAVGSFPLSFRLSRLAVLPILPKGFRISWARPAAICPRAARRSLSRSLIDWIWLVVARERVVVPKSRFCTSTTSGWPKNARGA